MTLYVDRRSLEMIEDERARGGDLRGDYRLKVHWIGDAPTSLHGNGAASFSETTRNPAEVTCKLCLTLLAHEPSEQES